MTDRSPKAGPRLGLLGGTFDPVHHAHLRAAVELHEHYALDTLYLIPNHRPVHRGAPEADTDARIEMLELALQGVAGLAIDEREARRERPSWTVESLEALRSEQPDAMLLFCLGVDAFSKFDAWHRWEDILNLAHLIVLDRPEADWSDFAVQLLDRQRHRVGESIEAADCGVIERFAPTAMAISATDIRRRAGAGQSLRYLVPDPVCRYIESHELYSTT